MLKPAKFSLIDSENKLHLARSSSASTRICVHSKRAHQPVRAAIKFKNTNLIRKLILLLFSK